MSILDVALFAVSLAIMLVGVMAIIIPFAPGIAFVWFGIFLYAGATKFSVIPQPLFFTLTFVAVLLVFLEYLAHWWRKRQYPTATWGVFGAILGALIGVAYDGLAAAGIGLFIGVLAGELLISSGGAYRIPFRDHVLVGFVSRTSIRLLVAAVMIGIFLVRFFGQF